MDAFWNRATARTLAVRNNQRFITGVRYLKLASTIAVESYIAVIVSLFIERNGGACN
jgi:hypothetical protein